MKLIHLSDLHLGKRVNEFSMLEDQRFILKKILQVIDDEQPQAVMIAGDVYDKSIPAAEAVQLFDDFLCRLADRGLQVFVISGNHDSAERLSFASRLIDASGIHLAPVYSGDVRPVTLEDADGPVHFYMLPFLKPAQVRGLFSDEAEEITGYTEAVSAEVRHMHVDTAERNVLITHQFVTGAARSASEEISVGGADNVDAAVFAPFDYVALGHIHGPQNVGSPRIRYCGTPLKYSFSEAGHVKSVTVVTLGPKESGYASIDLRTVPLVPLHDMRELRGTYMELTDRRNYQGTKTDDYLHITLTDEEDIPDVIGRLRVVYPQLMRLDYDNRRTRSDSRVRAAEEMAQKTPIQLFELFYEQQNGRPVSEEQHAILQRMITRIWECPAGDAGSSVAGAGPESVESLPAATDADAGTDTTAGSEVLL